MDFGTELLKKWCWKCGFYMKGKEWVVLEACPEGPTYLNNEMLDVETIAFKGFPIASFRTKPKDCREGGEPITDDDMFIKTVWSSKVHDLSGWVTI